MTIDTPSVAARSRAEASHKTRCPGASARTRAQGPSRAPLLHALDSPRQVVSGDPASRPCPATLRGPVTNRPLIGS